MTTVAYFAGEIAADTGLFGGDLYIGCARKIAGRDGALAGACGSASYIAAFLSWFESGADEPPKASADTGDRAFIVRGKTITVYEASGPFVIDRPYYAIGSGRDLAVGAMAAGASAERAVRIACNHDAYTRGPIEALSAG